MKRFVQAVLLLGLGVVVMASAQAEIRLEDDRGRVIVLHEPPRRIVSLLPSLTEMVCQLERCDRLVGVDRYSTWPESLKALPRVGGGLDPNVELIVALKPDLILAAVTSRSADRFTALGIPVMALEPRTHADVRRILDKLGLVLGVSDAQRIWRRIDAGVTAAAQSVPQAARGLRVYFEVNRGPYGAGEGSFIGETLARLGVGNILPESLGPFPKLNPEFVVRANPDLIMISERSVDGLAQRPGWASIRALREDRVCIFSAADFDILVRPGPRMDEGARIMAKCLADKGAARAAAKP